MDKIDQFCKKITSNDQQRIETQYQTKTKMGYHSDEEDDSPQIYVKIMESVCQLMYQKD